MQKIKQIWQYCLKHRLILLCILTLVGWFYWFQWRPTRIKRICAPYSYAGNKYYEGCIHTTEYFDTLDEIAKSMKAHKYQYGRFNPGFWLSDTFSEDVQAFCFVVYDDMEKANPSNRREWLANKVDEYMTLKEVVPVQIPKQFWQWYDKNVIVAPREPRTLHIIHAKEYEEWEADVRSRAKNTTAVDFALKVNIPCKITETGELLISQDLYGHLGSNGREEVRVESGHLIIQKNTDNVVTEIPSADPAFHTHLKDIVLALYDKYLEENKFVMTYTWWERRVQSFRRFLP